MHGKILHSQYIVTVLHNFQRVIQNNWDNQCSIRVLRNHHASRKQQCKSITMLHLQKFQLHRTSF